MKSSSVTIQMKAIEQYFPVVVLITLYKTVLTFESSEVSSFLDQFFKVESFGILSNIQFCECTYITQFLSIAVSWQQRLNVIRNKQIV